MQDCSFLMCSYIDVALPCVCDVRDGITSASAPPQTHWGGTTNSSTENSLIVPLSQNDRLL